VGSGQPDAGRSARVPRAPGAQATHQRSPAGAGPRPATSAGTPPGTATAAPATAARPVTIPRASARALALRAGVVLVMVAAGAAAVLAGSAAVVAGCALVLAGAATALGLMIGEQRRVGLRDEIEGREVELKRALTELEISQAEMVRRLSMAVEFRDEDTGAHIERIGRFSRLLSEQIGMDPEFCERISHAAPLHDVGKVAIPDAILLKPGPLTPQERAIVETHAEEGYRLVRGSSSAILEMAATIALSHQEKWDGSGYPRGLAGEAIPLEGRIVAIADVFDALTSDRVYRKAFPVDEAVTIMREQRGRHFDPVLLDAFMEVLESSGIDARPRASADPLELAERTLQTFVTALERGDAEMAESAIAAAIEDGMSPVGLHGEVMAPAVRRTEELVGAGELAPDDAQLALGITRRVLATLRRYMLGGRDPDRERVLLVSLEGEEHPLELEMMNDQLSAAGYRTALVSHVTHSEIAAAVESHSPQAVFVGALPRGAQAELQNAMAELHALHGELPFVLVDGAAAQALAHELAHEHPRWRLVERIDQAVPAVQELLASRLASAAR
jgi:methanogenic corrinoid protein MtbC1